MLMITSEFSAEPLTSPMLYQRVDEGHFASASYGTEATHLATFGLMTCKAVSVYNPETQYGVLAHIDGTANVERVLMPIVDAYDGSLSGSEVSIVQAVESEDTFLWPDLDTIAEYFMRHNPRSLRVDRNVHNLWLRGIALCLKSGTVYEAEYADEIEMQSTSNLKQSRPLRSNDLWL